MDTLVPVVNLDNIGISQYTNFNFLSLAVGSDGKLYGATADGIYLIGDSNTDSGSSIYSHFSFPATDFGTTYKKRLRSLSLAGKGNGGFRATVYSDESETESRSFSLSNTTLKQQAARVFIGDEGIGSNLKIEIENVLGSDFTFSRIDTAVIFRSRG